MDTETRVLIVEDDAYIVKTLSAFLESEGFSCAAADGQEAALELFSQNEYDLVLLDVALHARHIPHRLGRRAQRGDGA